MNRGEEGKIVGDFENKVGGAGVVAPRLKMRAGPTGEVDGLAVREQGFGVGPREEEKHFDDFRELGCLGSDQGESLFVLGGGAFAAERDVNLAEDGGEWSAELVRGVAVEAGLAFEGFLETVEEAVERVGKLLKFVAGGEAG